MICGVPGTELGSMMEMVGRPNLAQSELPETKAVRNGGRGTVWKGVRSLSLQVTQKRLEAHQAQTLEGPNILAFCYSKTPAG